MCENDHEKLMTAFFGQRNSTSSPCTKTTPTPQSGLTVTQDIDRILFTGGGNRTHVAVSKNLLTTEALYHSATEVLIEFDKYFGSRVV